MIYTIIALLLAVIAVGAILSTQRWLRPRCPLCRGYQVSEREDGYVCLDCGAKFLEY
jgi:tRNA(Ile2) C34 agmatinyltransferase TiaS